jgi:hypothetical protein
VRRAELGQTSNELVYRLNGSYIKDGLIQSDLGAGGKMTRIVLNAEQAAVLAGAKEPVRICLPDGSIAGWVSSTMHLPPKKPGCTPAEIEEAEKGLDSVGSWRTTNEIFGSLHDLKRA